MRISLFTFLLSLIIACNGSTFGDASVNTHNSSNAGKASDSGNSLPDYSLFCNTDSSKEKLVSKDCFIADGSNERIDASQVRDVKWSHISSNTIESSVTSETSSDLISYSVIYSGAESSKLIEDAKSTVVKVEFYDVESSEKLVLDSKSIDSVNARVSFSITDSLTEFEHVSFDTWNQLGGSWNFTNESLEITQTSTAEQAMITSPESYNSYFMRLQVRSKDAPEKSQYAVVLSEGETDSVYLLFDLSNSGTYKLVQGNPETKTVNKVIEELTVESIPVSAANIEVYRKFNSLKLNVFIRKNLF